VLRCRNHVGLLSEDIDPATGERVGQLPADLLFGGPDRLGMRLSRTWEAAFWRGCSRLNRVALPRERGGAAGGLAVAMRDALRRGGGLCSAGAANSATSRRARGDRDGGKSRLRDLDLSHCRSPGLLPRLTPTACVAAVSLSTRPVRFRRDTFEGYLRVNAAFAAALNRCCYPTISFGPMTIT